MFEDDRSLKEINKMMCGHLVPSKKQDFHANFQADLHFIRAYERLDRYTATFNDGAKNSTDIID
jgi:hypothetical protein